MDTDKIVESYLKTQSTYETARILSVNRNKVYRTLKRLKIPMTGMTGPKQKNKIPFDETYFSSIDTKEKAYWLGFIAADGCVHRNVSGSNEFSIALAMKDYEHLALLKQALKSDHAISVNKSTNTCKLRIVRKNFTDDLIRHGIVQNKTMQPFHVPKNLMTHWLRGLFDGDGSFWVRKRPGLKQQVAFSFSCATLEQVEQIKQIFEQNQIFGGSIYQATANGYHYSLEGNKKVASITNLIYSDREQSPCLQRKIDIVKHFLQA